MDLDNSAGYGRVEHNALDVLSEYFDVILKAKKPPEELTIAAKTASAALGSVQSFRKSQASARGLGWSMAQRLASNPAQLAEYIRMTAPEVTTALAIPEKAAE